MVRKVKMYSDPKNPGCVEMERFLEKQEINLQIHNIRTDPLDFDQLSRLLRHFDLKHFLNDGIKKRRKSTPEISLHNRKELIRLIAEDNSLLRLPIIVSGRLMTVGHNYDRVLVMLEIKEDHSVPGGEIDPEVSEDNR
jgi:arsenate reductase-like glutaredoxin family protein